MSKQGRGKLIAVLIIVIIVAAVCLTVWIRHSAADESSERIQSIRDTINERTLQCYVIEGAYPESLSYLEENYGLTIDKKTYRIVYQPVAENLPPTVKVIERKETGNGQ